LALLHTPFPTLPWPSSPSLTSSQHEFSAPVALRPECKLTRAEVWFALLAAVYTEFGTVPGMQQELTGFLNECLPHYLLATSQSCLIGLLRAHLGNSTDLFKQQKSSFCETQGGFRKGLNQYYDGMSQNHMIISWHPTTHQNKDSGHQHLEPSRFPLLLNHQDTDVGCKLCFTSLSEEFFPLWLLFYPKVKQQMGERHAYRFFYHWFKHTHTHTHTIYQLSSKNNSQLVLHYKTELSPCRLRCFSRLSNHVLSSAKMNVFDSLQSLFYKTPCLLSHLTLASRLSQKTLSGSLWCHSPGMSTY
jgi:hypothetical protein